jgi:hypothetical protein
MTVVILQTVIIVLLLVVLGVIYWRSRGQTSLQGSAPASGRMWLDYGNFFIVALGLVFAMIGFLVVLYFHGGFQDGTQALGFLTALFGVITGLVGTYFGVKSSGDAALRSAEALARNGTTPPSPTVLSVDPPRDAVNVRRDINVSATFSIAMNPDTLTTDNFWIMSAATNLRVEGTVTYDPSSATATFTPTKRPLEPGVYQATITTGVKGRAGNALTEDYTWQFTVA